MEEVTIYNIYDYVIYDYRDNVLHIYWDHTNQTINDILYKEQFPNRTIYQSHTYNCFWVKELKQVISWKPGQKIYMRTISNSYGEMCITVYDKPSHLLVFEEIDEDGYLHIPINIQYVNNGFQYNLQKINCLYNNLLDEENHHQYILK